MAVGQRFRRAEAAREDGRRMRSAERRPGVARSSVLAAVSILAAAIAARSASPAAGAMPAEAAAPEPMQEAPEPPASPAAPEQGAGSPAPASSDTPPAAPAAPGDEEEEWLYGDENEAARPEEEDEVEEGGKEVKSTQPVAPRPEEESTENGVAKPKVAVTEEDSDSDSDDDDDDVHVTIGDIKTGAPQYGSYGTAPVNLNIKTGGRIYGSSGGKVKGVDLEAPGSINGLPLVDVDLDSFEDKPWRKPGADLSDYFNYGFNEDTWKAYCEKQKRLRMGLEALPVTSTTNKISVQELQILEDCLIFSHLQTICGA